MTDYSLEPMPGVSCRLGSGAEERSHNYHEREKRYAD
jgi:hypothetical protein